jgi:hypothetical protein
MSQVIRRHRLARTLRGERYKELVRYAVEHDFILGLVVRHQLRQSPNLARVLRRLEPWQLDRELVYAWPGTRLGESTGGADLLTFQCTLHSGEVLTSEAESLWQWVQPDLPEDMCFFRQDGRPFFFSVTHERQAFLDADPVEIEELRQRDLKYFVPAGNTGKPSPAVPEP